jgi:hypothetical protein
LSVLHAEERLEWSLLFTLHGEANWDSSETAAVAAFLKENFDREPAFASDARDLVGNEIFQAIVEGTVGSASTLAVFDQQELLMLYVPKKIAQIAHERGWRVETARNLRYGGSRQRAPMVTWIIDFKWDRRISSHPDAIYRDSLRLVLAKVGYIAEDGTIS